MLLSADRKRIEVYIRTQRRFRVARRNNAPRRRAAGASQSTLSFGTQSRITKPTSTPTTLHKAKKADSPAVVPSDQSEWGTPEPQQLLADAEPSKPHVAELVVRQQAAVARQEVPSSAEEQRALRMSQKDIQSYWEQQEKSRKAPRSEWRFSNNFNFAASGNLADSLN
ncbi:hypothetical protein N7462_005153 [Penicillium macrosclerotiorum]|uniref:uncharacterized protein n=1 Tax=Penicillium macrosclerotiorum TaxID=303699 RepID=UPI002546A469|nr:uncharacterized protein N7462_005153 [Penicillium macrosclerotiorum]KAJ5690761.1 hypothetical protein N7462_005153 [Penicillium macrosclerotiorum]